MNKLFIEYLTFLASSSRVFCLTPVGSCLGISIANVVKLSASLAPDVSTASALSLVSPNEVALSALSLVSPVR